MSWLVIVATFLAAGVEWVEALTIVLAVGMFKSWRTALLATASAFATLIVLIAVLRVTIDTVISISLARTTVGLFLLLFGLGWLYKAILRSSGLKAYHDEAEAFEEAKEDVMSHGRAFGIAFGGVFLEGLEVVFIVVALGGLDKLVDASIGAILSLVVVIAAGSALRHPLTRVPENAVKYAVGIMLTAFGTFFTGEGIGVTWWRDDLVLLPLIVAYAASSFGIVLLLRRAGRRPRTEIAAVRLIRAVVKEVWGLFVTDGLLAACAVAAALGAATLIGGLTGQRSTAGIVLVLGVVAGIWAAVSRAAASASKRPRPAIHDVPAAIE
jgi:uncharacterized membrane protein